MPVNCSLSSPEAVAQKGEEIYRESYKDKYESEHADEFLAIDVTTGQAYLAQTSEESLQKARDESPTGLFHLIQIGHSGAFRVSYTAPKSALRLNVGRVFR